MSELHQKMGDIAKEDDLYILITLKHHEGKNTADAQISYTTDKNTSEFLLEEAKSKII